MVGFQGVMNKLTSSAVSIAVSGAAAYGGARMLGLTASVNFPKDIISSKPFPVALAIIVAASSAIQEVSFDYIVPLIAKNAPALNFSHMYMSPAITGVASLGLLALGDMREFKEAGMKVFIVGAISQGIGNYAEGFWKGPQQLSLRR